MKVILKYILSIIIFSMSLPVGFFAGYFYTYCLSEKTNIIPGLKEAVVLATTKKPETFTELYFEDHINLPSKVELGEKQSFSFTIHNLQYQDMTYKYDVKAVDDKGEQTLSTASVTLPHDEYKTINESYVIATNSGRMKIQVTLVNQDQSIAYWME